MAFPTESRLYTYTVYHGIAWCAMAFLAFALLTACSLLAGLTLALGGLDPTWLQLRSVAGTPRQRQQAIVVRNIKSHSTWMLCSMIISSVACGEYLPFVIQSLWHGSQQWVPILISTVFMALYAEILPQYTIPRQPIVWGYYCSPIIWSCMWLTGIVSYPLACLLDAVAGRSAGYSIFTREEIAAVIKYHDLSENNRGTIGPDATRVMLGALNLDSRSIGGNIALVPETNDSIEKDVEKADLIVLQELLVHWSDVKTVDIDDVVDEEFMSRLSEWSYSFIPVLGKHEFHKVEIDPATVEYRWEGKQIFGSLHIKSLLDVEIRDAIKSMGNSVTVRDILLCQLPVIPVDMPVYDILSVFQLGIARMAIVVPAPLDARERHQKDGAAPKKLLWTALETACTGSSRSVFEHTPRESPVDLNADATLCQVQSISALKSPKPIGIVTYEDIISAILQKPNPEENNFLNGCNILQQRKCKKASGRIKFACSYVQNRHGAFSRQKSTASRPSIPTTMRRRNVSSNLSASTKAHKINGISECINRLSGTEACASSKYENKITEVSCIQSSINTRCGRGQSVWRTGPSSLTQTESLPSRRGFFAVLPDGSVPSWRHVSAAPRLPQLQRVTPFSRQGYSSYENMNEEHSIGGDIEPSICTDSPFVGCGSQSEEVSETPKSELEIAEGSKCTTIPEDSVGGTRDDSQEAFYLLSWCPAGFIDVTEWTSQLQERTTCTTRIETSCVSISSSEALAPEDQPNILSYQGFPPELLINKRKENQFPNRVSNTLPRMIGPLINSDAFSHKDDSTYPPGDESLHSDRALLPSQERVANDTTVLAISGARSSSFWV